MSAITYSTTTRKLDKFEAKLNNQLYRGFDHSIMDLGPLDHKILRSLMDELRRELWGLDKENYREIIADLRVFEVGEL